MLERLAAEGGSPALPQGRVIMPVADVPLTEVAAAIKVTGDQEEEYDEKPRSILLGLMKQLKFGMDLTKVTLPTFVLEPRSLLEKYTDFLSHADILLRAASMADPVMRMVEMCKWWLSGFHVRPKGVKKPYNPILGEFFRCFWDHPPASGIPGPSRTYYVAEQVSHHPPISAFYFCNRKAGIVCNGQCYTKSKFLGNSAAAIMEGEAIIHSLRYGEQYTMNFPTAFVRGIILGKLVMEMCGPVHIVCPQSHLCWDLEFKSKGFIMGSYNRILGRLRPWSEDPKKDAALKKTTIASVSGHWSSVITIKDHRTNKESVLFDAAHAEITPKHVAVEEAQAENESRRLWRLVTRALRAGDMDTATAEKTALEEAQRAGVRDRETRQVPWQQRFFRLDANGRWVYNHINVTAYNPADDEDARPFEGLPALRQGATAVTPEAATMLPAPAAAPELGPAAAPTSVAAAGPARA